MLVIVTLAALGLGAFAASHWLTPTPPVAAELRSAAVYDTPRALPPVTLQTTTGATGAATTLLQGHWRVVFFGFTHCPGVCPGTLALMVRLEQALATLPAAQRPLMTFISVDPKRDTGAIIGPYLRQFGPQLEGFTGAETDTDALAQYVGVAVQRQPADAGGDYMVDHTAALFVLDDRARVRGILTTPHELANLIHDYRLIAGVQP